MLKPIIECFQNIPCNPCEFSCKRGAITVGEPLTNIPKLDADKCIGCGICVASCPGLAITLIDEEESLVAFAYEYLPIPKINQQVNTVDENGKILGKGKVIKILKPLKDDPTVLLVISSDKEKCRFVRGIERGGLNG